MFNIKSGECKSKRVTTSPVKMVITKKMTITYIGEDVEKLGHSCSHWECKMVQSLCKTM